MCLCCMLCMQGNHIYTSGATGTNAAVIKGALRAEQPQLLTVILPQSRSKQPQESRELLEQVWMPCNSSSSSVAPIWSTVAAIADPWTRLHAVMHHEEIAAVKQGCRAPANAHAAHMMVSTALRPVCSQQHTTVAADEQLHS